MKFSKAQVGMEYMAILGFVTIILIAVLSMAYFYSGGIKDRLKLTQINNFANKIISTSESVYYYGKPSRATISVYIPEGINNITIINNVVYIETHLSSNIEKNEFHSNVPISGNLSITPGIKKIKIEAEDNTIRIGLA